MLLRSVRSVRPKIHRVRAYATAKTKIPGEPIAPKMVTAECPGPKSKELMKTLNQYQVRGD